jgi:hypothetical protein
MAAYQIGHMQKVTNDNRYHGWFKQVSQAWDFMKSRGPAKDGKPEALSPPFVDYAAEAEFTLLDEDIAAKWDNQKERKKYCGSVETVLGKYDKGGQRLKDGAYIADAHTADKYDQALDKIARTYPSVEWTPAAIARQGAIYDGLRTGLYNTTTAKGSCFALFTPQQENVLKQMENSGRDNLIDQAGQIRDVTREAWRTKKESELAGTDAVMVRRYAQAVYLARRYNVRNEQVSRAIAKLAYYTDIIGDAKMKEYVTNTSDPTDPSKKLEYQDGQYVQSRPGLTTTPPPSGDAKPLPVAP